MRRVVADAREGVDQLATVWGRKALRTSGRLMVILAMPSPNVVADVVVLGDRVRSRAAHASVNPVQNSITSAAEEVGLFVVRCVPGPSRTSGAGDRGGDRPRPGRPISSRSPAQEQRPRRDGREASWSGWCPPRRRAGCSPGRRVGCVGGVAQRAARLVREGGSRAKRGCAPTRPRTARCRRARSAGERLVAFVRARRAAGSAIPATGSRGSAGRSARGMGDGAVERHTSAHRVTDGRSRLRRRGGEEWRGRRGPARR